MDKDINKMKMLILSAAAMALDYKKTHHGISDDAVIEYIVKNSDELINNL